jgi:hypothetical protein
LNVVKVVLLQYPHHEVTSGPVRLMPVLPDVMATVPPVTVRPLGRVNPTRSTNWFTFEFVVLLRGPVEVLVRTMMRLFPLTEKSARPLTPLALSV